MSKNCYMLVIYVERSLLPKRKEIATGWIHISGKIGTIPVQFAERHLDHIFPLENIFMRSMTLKSIRIGDLVNLLLMRMTKKKQKHHQ